MKNIIVAYDRQRAIGVGGGLLWKPGEMRADMQHFREITMGSVMIMGRKTLDSIGIALPGRETIMVTRHQSSDIQGVKTAHSLDEAYAMADSAHEIFIVGGGEIYEQTLTDAKRIYATEVDAIISGADTYFPSLDAGWHKTKEEHFPADENNRYAYGFVTYEKQG